MVKIPNIDEPHEQNRWFPLTRFSPKSGEYTRTTLAMQMPDGVLIQVLNEYTNNGMVFHSSIEIVYVPDCTLFAYPQPDGGTKYVVKGRSYSTK